MEEAGHERARPLTSRFIRTDSRTYSYDTGFGLLVDPEYWSKAMGGPSQVAVLTSHTLRARFRRVSEALGDPLVLAVPDGEAAKSLDVVGEIYGQLVEARFPRSGVLVGLGGGSVTDLAGFVAGTWKRGVRLIQAPTTLTGQVDAAVGGKAGVNLPAGKNLVGVIYQPERVVADLSVLETVPRRDFLAGMAEVLKCGYIADPRILSLISEWSYESSRTDDLTAELVRRSVEVKADAVERDELDLGVRRHLNYGHTLGQALEAAMGFGRMNHGEAVGLGMLYAAAVAELLLGCAQGDLLGSTRWHLRRIGLPVDLPDSIPFEVLWGLMAHDKKAGSAGREFVICERPGVARLVSAPNQLLARDAYRLATSPDRNQHTA